jgi:hypothetical protein
MSMVNSMLYFNPQFRTAALHHATTAFNFTLASSLENCSSYNRSTIMINFADYDSSERWLMNFYLFIFFYLHSLLFYPARILGLKGLLQ